MPAAHDAAYAVPKGFQAAGVACGLKRDGRLDLALIASDRPCAPLAVHHQPCQGRAGALLTRRSWLRRAPPSARCIANTGSANACTGDDGWRARSAPPLRWRGVLGCAPAEVLALSTGMIGLPLALEPLERGLPVLHAQLSPEGWPAAAEAIMTNRHAPEARQPAPPG